MQPFSPIRANPTYSTRIHPALTSFADECFGMLARLIAYVGALALLAIIGIHLWDQLPLAAEPAACWLTQPTAENEPKLAELFASAELRPSSCAPAATSATPSDWVTAPENPLLRGAF